MVKKTEKTQTFESAFAELETIIEKLENGDISLEESLQAFERGTQLTRTCSRILNQAEKRLKQLVKDGEGFKLESADLE